MINHSCSGAKQQHVVHVFQSHAMTCSSQLKTNAKKCTYKTGSIRDLMTLGTKECIQLRENGTLRKEIIIKKDGEERQEATEEAKVLYEQSEHVSRTADNSSATLYLWAAKRGGGQSYASVTSHLLTSGPFLALFTQFSGAIVCSFPTSSTGVLTNRFLDMF